jgi:pimeloyl-ACP methyl ester carboxylesterase
LSWPLLCPLIRVSASLAGFADEATTDKSFCPARLSPDGTGTRRVVTAKLIYMDSITGNGVAAVTLAAVATAGVVVVASRILHEDEDLSPLPLPAGLLLIRENQRRITVRGRVRHVSVLRCARRATQDVVVLFVPGAGGQAEQFFGQAPLFASNGALAGCAVAVFFSHASHGPNAREPYAGWESLSFQSLADDLVAMCEFALEQVPDPPRAKVIVVAHSLGSALTVSALNRLPRVASVMLIAPPVKGSSEATKPNAANALKWTLLRMPSAILDGFRMLDRRGPGATSASVSRMVGRRGDGVDPDLARLQKVWNAATPSRIVQALSRQTPECIPDSLQYGAFLRAASGCKDVVVVAGEHDQLTSAESVKSILTYAGKTARFELVNGDVGHQVMAERPQRINKLIASLVDANRELW